MGSLFDDLYESDVDTVSNQPGSSSLAAFLNVTGARLAAEPEWRPEPPKPLGAMGDKFVVNFETNGTNIRKHKPIGVTVGTYDGEWQQYYPFAHVGAGSANLSETQVRDFLLTELRGKILFNQHLKFDIHMGRRIGVDFEEIGCTVGGDPMLWAALIDGNRPSYNIDALARDYLGGVDVERIDERIMELHHPSEMVERARYQAKLVSRLCAKMIPVLDRKDLHRVRKIEEDCTFGVVEMEKNGAKIDVDLLQRWKIEIEQTIATLSRYMSEQVGGGLFKCDKKSWTRLFEKFGLPMTYLEEDDPMSEGTVKKESFKTELLEDIEHPLVVVGLNLWRVMNLYSKIYKKYAAEITPEGVIYFEYHQLRRSREHGSGVKGTITGRFSGDAQQVPNIDKHKLKFGLDWFPRKLFISDTGTVLEADAAQEEFRIAVHLSGNERILAEYEKETDTNVISFHNVMWERFKEFKPELTRTEQKSFNFAKQYGAQTLKAALMMKNIKNDVYWDIKKKRKAAKKRLDERLIEADGNPALIKAARKDYFEAMKDDRLNSTIELEDIYRKAFPEGEHLVKKYEHLARRQCNSSCRRNPISEKLHQAFPHQGYVTTLGGRRIETTNDAFAYKGLNYVSQGTGGDIGKLKLAELHRARKHTGLLLRMHVHDSFMGDVHDPETERRVKEVLWEQSIPMKVKIRWDVHTGPTWADCK